MLTSLEPRLAREHVTLKLVACATLELFNKPFISNIRSWLCFNMYIICTYKIIRVEHKVEGIYVVFLHLLFNPPILHNPGIIHALLLLRGSIYFALPLF